MTFLAGSMKPRAYNNDDDGDLFRVVITGAAGRIGSQLVEELSRMHDLCLLDCRPMPGQKSVPADLAQEERTEGWKRWFSRKSSRWRESFQSADVVVHLAANSQSLALWEKVLPDNVQGTWNVIDTATKYRVPREWRDYRRRKGPYADDNEPG